MGGSERFGDLLWGWGFPLTIGLRTIFVCCLSLLLCSLSLWKVCFAFLFFQNRLDFVATGVGPGVTEVVGTWAVFVNLLLEVFLTGSGGAGVPLTLASYTTAGSAIPVAFSTWVAST